MEMQPILFGRPLPHAHIPPALAVAKMRKRRLEFFPERFFRMQFIGICKRNKIIEFLQICFLRHSDTAGDQFFLLASEIELYK